MALVFVMAASACGGSSGPSEEDQVRAAFRTYKQAALSGDGEAAASVVSEDTIRSFDRFRSLALHADSEDVHGYSMFNRFVIAAFRLQIPPETLETLSGPEVFIFAVDHQLGIDEDSISQLELGDISAFEGGTVAKAKIIVDGEETPSEFEFTKENGAWKLDLEALFGFANLALQQVAEEAGLSEDDLIFRALEFEYGRDVGPEIWDPPRP
jgi:hypothetical protein